MADEQVFVLHEAAKRGYVEQLKEAIDSGNKNVGGKDTLGNTPLHWAASGGHLEAVQFLLSLKVSVNDENAFGDTPLHRAAWKGHPQVCEALIQHGAGPSRDKVNHEGKKPIDLARVFEVKKIIAPTQGEEDEEFDQEDEDSD